MKFRKKPVVINAFKVKDLILMAQSSFWSLPEEIRAAYDKGNIIFAPGHISIGTLEGWMRADFEDWVIQGISNELYPCKPDIFEKTYENMED